MDTTWARSVVSPLIFSIIVYQKHVLCSTDGLKNQISLASDHVPTSLEIFKGNEYPRDVSYEKPLRRWGNNYHPDDFYTENEDTTDCVWVDEMCYTIRDGEATSDLLKRVRTECYNDCDGNLQDIVVLEDICYIDYKQNLYYVGPKTISCEVGHDKYSWIDLRFFDEKSDGKNHFYDSCVRIMGNCYPANYYRIWYKRNLNYCIKIDSRCLRIYDSTRQLYFHSDYSCVVINGSCYIENSNQLFLVELHRKADEVSCIFTNYLGHYYECYTDKFITIEENSQKVRKSESQCPEEIYPNLDLNAVTCILKDKNCYIGNYQKLSKYPNNEVCGQGGGDCWMLDNFDIPQGYIFVESSCVESNYDSKTSNMKKEEDKVHEDKVQKITTDIASPLLRALAGTLPESWNEKPSAIVYSFAVLRENEKLEQNDSEICAECNADENNISDSENASFRTVSDTF